MVYPPRLAPGVDPGATLHELKWPRRDDSRAADCFEEDIRYARAARANLLLVGTDAAIAAMLPQAVADNADAHVIACHSGRLQLDDIPAGAGTIVFRDVDTLTAFEQGELFNWIQSAGLRKHVVSTASAPLLPLVEAGDFDAALYYRLNIVYCALTD